MKDVSFEAKLIAANPRSQKTDSFVKNVMNQLSPQSEAPSRLSWLHHLPRPAIAVAGFVGVVLVGSAAYAAVHFAPALVQLLDKQTNSRGATEYSIANFKDCQSQAGGALQRVEVKKGVSLSDEEVKKIVQAKCELQWLQTFTGHAWPATDTAHLKDGDTFSYPRTDRLGIFVSATESMAKISTGDIVDDYQAASGEKIRAFAAGEEIALSDLKPGDTVFTISRISEAYQRVTGPRGTVRPVADSPKIVGTVGLFKMSLPQEYYQQKQQLVTEIPACIGNEHELCAATPSVEVYPRSGEGGKNPLAQIKADVTYRQISGTVTELRSDGLTLKSRLGTVYHVTVGSNGFAAYNRDYAQLYGEETKVKVGSSVMVYYAQPQHADPKEITPEHIQMVNLQLETLNPKTQPLKQY